MIYTEFKKSESTRSGNRRPVPLTKPALKIKQLSGLVSLLTSFLVPLLTP